MHPITSPGDPRHRNNSSAKIRQITSGGEVEEGNEIGSPAQCYLTRHHGLIHTKNLTKFFAESRTPSKSSTSRNSSRHRHIIISCMQSRRNKEQWDDPDELPKDLLMVTYQLCTRHNVTLLSLQERKHIQKHSNISAVTCSLTEFVIDAQINAY